MNIRRYIDIVEAAETFTPRPFINTQEFAKWFKGSKVVDGSGKPLLCFHGTFSSFSEFKLQSEKRRANGFNRLGFWFDTDNMTPDYFAGASRHWSGKSNIGNVMPVYLSIKKPLIFNSEPIWRDDQKILDKHAEIEDFRSFNQHVEKMDRKDSFDHMMSVTGMSQYIGHKQMSKECDAYRNEAISEGYDGVYLQDTLADAGSRMGKVSNWWIAFHSNQIKSALTNTGHFSSDNPNIDESFPSK